MIQNRFVWLHYTQPQYALAVAWMSARIWGTPRNMGPGTALCVYRGEDLAAVVLFHNYHRDRASIEISGASSGGPWFTRQVAQQMAEYVFGQMGCNLVITKTQAANTRLCRLWERFGFRNIILPEAAGPGRDEAYLFMTKNDWRPLDEQ